MAGIDLDTMSDRTHVVHVIGSLQTGGAEKMLVNLVKSIDKKRFRYTVLCLTAAGEHARELDGEDVEILVHTVRWRNFLRDIFWLVSWLRSEKVQILHSHMFFASLWARVAGLIAGTPVLITTEHSQEHWKKTWQVKVDNWLSRRTFHHIAVSDDVKSIRVERDGIPGEKITVIPNGVPLPRMEAGDTTRDRIRMEFGVGRDQPLIGTVGRVIEAKGYCYLLEAIGVLRKQIPNLHWLQIGTGPEGPSLARQADALGISNAITFCGLRNDVGDLLRAIDVWVMSSINEGLPVALLEAMAAAKCIVTTDAGGITDAVTDEVSALVVRTHSSQELADGILRAFGDRELARAMSSAAREQVEANYSISAVASRIVAIYEAGLAATAAAR